MGTLLRSPGSGWQPAGIWGIASGDIEEHCRYEQHHIISGGNLDVVS